MNLNVQRILRHFAVERAVARFEKEVLPKSNPMPLIVAFGFFLGIGLSAEEIEKAVILVGVRLLQEADDERREHGECLSVVQEAGKGASESPA